ncbi:MAG TPA: UDP-N-acetylglucosamine--N-acetylmuramyl-(pentapeptide) pyrophosphoryl-undecaprenol N-acetylglucosamine transferase [Acidimicrobiia bacterium]|nr:UDP-N-acetylglucosamine--N-acetylmuramyl-(pentapeptide) pyrophosphoryl-undecaprenol N-acetylglucosamine transferase [Acidimicrobiia bacterium]
MTYAVAAAGTGGHVYPALALAGALEDLGVARSEILFLGGNRLEARVVPEAGYPFQGFELARLRRTPTVDNLKIPWVVRRTARAMHARMIESGTRVVVGMGGYVTVPAASAAQRAGVPFFLQEQNAVPGLASRYAARRAVATFLGLPGKAERLPRSKVVGNPLRREIATLDRAGLREEAQRRYGISGSTVLGILGGSLGARVLNESASALAEGTGADAVVHLTGPDAFEDMTRMADASAVAWACRPFEADMQYFYAATDLVVCRAGAMTVSELAATGTPSVLVPLERVGQGSNARSLAATGGAVVVSESDVGELPETVAGILGDAAGLERMGADARRAGRPGGAMVIARRLLEAVRA